MTGLIKKNELTYKKRKYSTLRPPHELIDCTVFTIDYSSRKYIQIGLDPKETFNVKIHILTSTSYVTVSIILFSRLISAMSTILTNLSIEKTALENYEKKFQKNVMKKLLTDESFIISKLVSRGQHLLVVQAKSDTYSKILLCREELLKIQELQHVVNAVYYHKSYVTRLIVLEQLEIFVKYLDSQWKEKNSFHSDEMVCYIQKMSQETISSLISNDKPDYINQLISIAAKSVADAWVELKHSEIEVIIDFTLLYNTLTKQSL